MDVIVTIRYTTDEIDDGTGYVSVNDNINRLLTSTLPYMVDNVEIHFDVEDN